MKKWIAAAIALLILGGGIFMVSFVVSGFNFFAVDPETLTEKSYGIKDAFQNIEIKDNIADMKQAILQFLENYGG